MANVLRVPPENLWPTGAVPAELKAVMRAEGVPVPNESVVNYRPPPRPAPNLQELEAERQVHHLQMPVPPAPQLVAMPQQMVYSLPLGPGKHAQILISGPVGPRDIKRLIKYVELMVDMEETAVPVVAPAITPKRPRRASST